MMKVVYVLTMNGDGDGDGDGERILPAPHRHFYCSGSHSWSKERAGEPDAALGWNLRIRIAYQ